MKSKELFDNLILNLPNAELSVETDLLLENDENFLFRIVFTNNAAAFVLISIQVSFNKSDFTAKVNSSKLKGIPRVDTESIKDFVKKVNVKLLPYLKEYNNNATDYEKLAELYHGTRGYVYSKKFGF